MKRGTNPISLANLTGTGHIHRQGCGCGAPKGSHNSPTTEFKKGRVGINLGKKVSNESRRKMSLAKLGRKMPWRQGENCPFWKGGITEKNKAVRMSSEYANWRRKVYERDGYRCVWCGSKGAVVVDHIKPFALFESLRMDVGNGQTLCLECHKKTFTFGHKFKSIDEYFYAESLMREMVNKYHD